MNDLEKFLQDTLTLPESDEWNGRIRAYHRLTLVDPKKWAEAMRLLRLRGVDAAARTSGIYPLRHPKKRTNGLGMFKTTTAGLSSRQNLCGNAWRRRSTARTH